MIRVLALCFPFLDFPSFPPLHPISLSHLQGCFFPVFLFGQWLLAFCLWFQVFFFFPWQASPPPLHPIWPLMEVLCPPFFFFYPPQRFFFPVLVWEPALRSETAHSALNPRVFFAFDNPPFFFPVAVTPLFYPCSVPRTLLCWNSPMHSSEMRVMIPPPSRGTFFARLLLDFPSLSTPPCLLCRGCWGTQESGQPFPFPHYGFIGAPSLFHFSLVFLLPVAFFFSSIPPFLSTKPPTGRERSPLRPPAVSQVSLPCLTSGACLPPPPFPPFLHV